VISTHQADIIVTSKACAVELSDAFSEGRFDDLAMLALALHRRLKAMEERIEALLARAKTE